MDRRTTGLIDKFRVHRTDGTSAPGLKHDGCVYFVLDLSHDRHAPAALMAYAESCDADYPALSLDLRLAVKAFPLPQRPTEEPEPLAALTARAEQAVKAEHAMAEIWGSLCPDCGPENYPFMVQELTMLHAEHARMKAELALRDVQTATLTQAKEAAEAALLVLNADVNFARERQAHWEVEAYNLQAALVRLTAYVQHKPECQLSGNCTKCGGDHRYGADHLYQDVDDAEVRCTCGLDPLPSAGQASGRTPGEERRTWIADHYDRHGKLERNDRYDVCACGATFWRDGTPQKEQVSGGLDTPTKEPAISVWQPMETAPKGGGAELVTDPRWVVPPAILLKFADGIVGVGRWDHYYGPGGNGCTHGIAWVECISSEVMFDAQGAPTGWMPLPR